MRVLVTGAAGQVGLALAQTRPATVDWIGVDRGQLDIGDRARVLEAVRATRPTLIINAAAYTAVDRAEAEPELAHRVNGDGAAHLAEAARVHGARLIHLSTDYVFDGTRATPYRPDDPPSPLGVYGASKLAGERAVLERTHGAALVVRTSWVYARHGRNFLNTMIRLLRERPEVRVVADQIGTPTHADALARALWRASALPDLRGVFHWTDAGVASWYDFAVAIRERLQAAVVEAKLAAVAPITTAEFPTAARRPSYSVLDKSASWSVLGPALHWGAELARAVP